MAQSNYVVYHLHTECSLLDSCTNYKLYIDKAKELGQTAICFTEHGNTYNWIEKKMYCDQQGIKYIHGVEIYLTESFANKVRDNFHTILIALNQEGFKELNTLVDLSTKEDHFYYKPRLSFDEFKNISKNILKISACMASPLNRLRDENLIQYYDFLEIQPHINSSEQKEFNIWLSQMAKKYNKPLIAGTDTHSLDEYKSECRKILLEAKKITFTNEEEFDLTYKSYDELVDMFARQGALSKEDYMSAIENTNKMADMVETFELDTTFKYPRLYDDEEQALKDLINKKYAEKVERGIIEDDPWYKTQIREEMRVFKKIGMIGFMLFMSELISWCWDNNIPIGYCRGSVGGSTIAYITDIIDVNPRKWNTVFSRFSNEDRKEIGDIDVDIAPDQRDLVYKHIIDSFGDDKTAYILAMGTISDKGTIDEIGRVLSDRWKKEHGVKGNELDAHNPYSIEALKGIKVEFENDAEATKKKYPEIFKYYDGLLNTVISQSMHPAGIVVAPLTLPDNYGTFWSEGKRITSINMEEIHEVSLVKYDLLSLKNISIIRDCCKMVGIPYPKSHTLNWEDEKVWEDITCSPAGIFQFESDFAFKSLKQMAPKQLNDLSLTNAALRPSGTSYRDRLFNHEINTNPSTLIDDLLKQNYGFLVFQEDVISFLQNICGLSGSEADNIRRAIGRKQQDRLEAALPRILDGYCKMSPKPRAEAEDEAKRFLKIIEDASNYMFGFNHSTGYSMISYTCAYLRYYYPEEFIAAYLNNAGNEDDIKQGTQLAKIKNVVIKPIKFRKSRAIYSVDKANHVIYKGMQTIKYMNEQVSEDLYALRDIQFNGFIDLLDKFTGDSRQLDILVRLGYFSEFGPSKKLLKIVEYYNKYQCTGKTKQFKKDNLPLEAIPFIEKYAIKETDKQYSLDAEGVRNLLKDIVATIRDGEISLKERFEAESEYLGYITTVIPDAVGNAYIAALEVKSKGTIRATIYDLATGETIKVKIKQKVYSNTPVDKGDIISYRIVEDYPWRKGENGFYQDFGAEKEKFLGWYGINHRWD